MAHQLESTKNLEFHIRDVQEDKLHHYEIHEFCSTKVNLRCSSSLKELKNEKGETTRQKCLSRITVVPNEGGPITIKKVGKKKMVKVFLVFVIEIY